MRSEREVVASTSHHEKCLHIFAKILFVFLGREKKPSRVTLMKVVELNPILQPIFMVLNRKAETFFENMYFCLKGGVTFYGKTFSKSGIEDIGLAFTKVGHLGLRDRLHTSHSKSGLLGKCELFFE